MATLTIRIPDDKHERLRQMAKRRKISVNKLVDEFSTMALTQFDAEARFRSLSKGASVKDGLKVLDKLDAAFAKR